MVGIFHVYGNSMTPTIVQGDRLLVDKTPFQRLQVLGFSVGPERHPSLRREEVVIFAGTAGHAVKRAVGLPGDTVSMESGRLYVNSCMIGEPYTQYGDDVLEREPPPGGWHYRYLTDARSIQAYEPTGAVWGPLIVPADSYFVLGDNLVSSSDSRKSGFVAGEDLVGRPVLVLYSLVRRRISNHLVVPVPRLGRVGLRLNRPRGHVDLSANEHCSVESHQ